MLSSIFLVEWIIQQLLGFEPLLYLLQESQIQFLNFCGVSKGDKRTNSLIQLIQNILSIFTKRIKLIKCYKIIIFLLSSIRNSFMLKFRCFFTDSFQSLFLFLFILKKKLIQVIYYIIFLNRNVRGLFFVQIVHLQCQEGRFDNAHFSSLHKIHIDLDQVIDQVGVSDQIDQVMRQWHDILSQVPQEFTPNIFLNFKQEKLCMCSKLKGCQINF